jgi:hypothetical protein
MLIVLVLLATVVLRVALVSWAVFLLLPRGPQCRACQTEMLRLQNRLLDRWLPALERRWCLTCGWNGVVRRGPVPNPHPTPHVPTPPPTWQ